MAQTKTLQTLSEIGERLLSTSGKGCTEDERRLHAAYTFMMNLEMGGLSGYLYNISSDWEQLLHVKQVFRTLSQQQYLEAVTAIYDLVIAGPKDYEGAWEEWLIIVDPDNQLDRLQDQLDGSYDVIDSHLDDQLAEQS